MIVRTPVQGTVTELVAEVGARVDADDVVAVIESMKMEHEVRAGQRATVSAHAVSVGATVAAGDALITLEADPHPAAGSAPSSDGGSASRRGVEPREEAPPVAEAPRGAAVGGAAPPGEAAAESSARADLAEVRERHAMGRDERRPDAVERRRRRGQRTARENVDDLCDPGSFVEYGPLVIAAQRRRRDVDELIERTPADGLVTGIGAVDGAAVAVAAYDATVLAGTQGFQNHRKKDRLFELAGQRRIPLVLFAEGGGGRPGDVDAPGVSGLDVAAFQLFGRLSGLVPLVGIASGRCFAGNAALLGCCDVVIATEGANIGMGGPAMIEGGGLGTYAPEDIGPVSEQSTNGVVDVVVADEAAAVEVARRYLRYFTVPTAPWACAEQQGLRDRIPENRVRVYDVRSVLAELLDVDSVLELRRGFGAGVVTALARVEGRPLGVVANDPAHLGGALDADACDKAARFLQLCDAFDLPVLFCCDTPGFMVGPEAERAALVRHAARLFTTGANLTVPFMTVILRKGYGLGAQAMAGGSFKAPRFVVAWPTGEVGGMGLEGAVRLGFRRELDAIEDPDERAAAFDRMVAAAYEHGRALNAATHFELDDVIDPADTRWWITTALADSPPSRREGKKRPNLDTW